MKAVGNAEGTMGSAMDVRVAHQPWMGARVTMAPSADSFAGDFWLATSRSPFDRPRRAERVWDGVLALVFVSASAALGWAGAVWL